MVRFDFLPRPASFYLILVAFLIFPTAGFAASFYCQVAELAPAERRFRVSCTSSDLPNTGKVELRFADRFAGLEGLSERISGLQIYDAQERRVLPELPGNGVYRISSGHPLPLTIKYEVRLTRLNGVSGDPGRYALTSSLNAEFGVIFLSDTLPALCLANKVNCEPMAARMNFQLPDGWQVATTETSSFGSYDVPDVSRAAFVLGALRVHTINVERMKFQIVLAGDTGIAELQITPMVQAIARRQATLMKSEEEGDFLVMLAPFPIPLTGLRSSALTRGHSTLMMLNPEADAQRTLTHLQKHLAHELFHFYLPEAFRPRENFDWFWEGFTRYAALLTLNQLKLVNLREYLNEIELEYQAYKTNSLRDKVSLLAASPEKFTDAANYDLVYHKGTLVAALYDLELRWQSNGRKNLLDVLSEIYVNYRNRELGNAEVLATLRKAGKFDSFIQDYIQGTNYIDLEASVKPYGLRGTNISGLLRLKVANKISIKQNAILAQMGH